MSSEAKPNNDYYPLYLKQCDLMNLIRALEDQYENLSVAARDTEGMEISAPTNNSSKIILNALRVIDELRNYLCAKHEDNRKCHALKHT